MFSWKPKMMTVAGVMASFTKIIEDLDQIAEINLSLITDLAAERRLIDEKVEIADKEAARARLVLNKLTNLCGMDVSS